MKKTFAILAASTALGATIGLPAWSALQAWDETRPLAASPTASPTGEPQPVRVSDDDEKHGKWWFSKKKHQDDDDDEGDDDEGGARSPAAAPTGTVAPPKNGLFGNGAPPKVQMN